MDQQSIEQEIKTSRLPVFLEFFADWCGPCHLMKPMLDELEQENPPRVKIMRVDSDHEREIAQAYGVMALPTLLVFKNGQQVEKLVGLQRKPVLEKFL